MFTRPRRTVTSENCKLQVLQYRLAADAERDEKRGKPCASLLPRRLCLHADSFPMLRERAQVMSGVQLGQVACLGGTAGLLQRDMQELPFCVPRALAL